MNRLVDRVTVGTNGKAVGQMVLAGSNWVVETLSNVLQWFCIPERDLPGQGIVATNSTVDPWLPTTWWEVLPRKALRNGAML